MFLPNRNIMVSLTTGSHKRPVRPVKDQFSSLWQTNQETKALTSEWLNTKTNIWFHSILFLMLCGKSPSDLTASSRKGCVWMFNPSSRLHRQIIQQQKPSLSEDPACTRSYHKELIWMFRPFLLKTQWNKEWDKSKRTKQTGGDVVSTRPPPFPGCSVE